MCACFSFNQMDWVMMVIMEYLFYQALTIHDTKHCELWDLGTNFFIKEEDVKNQKTRLENNNILYVCYRYELRTVLSTDFMI